jgi:hypothetical protein
VDACAATLNVDGRHPSTEWQALHAPPSALATSCGPCAFAWQSVHWRDPTRIGITCRVPGFAEWQPEHGTEAWRPASGKAVARCCSTVNVGVANPSTR